MSIGFILFIKDKKYRYVFISVLTLAAVILASIIKYYPYANRMIIFLLPFLIIYIAKITDIKKWYIGWAIFCTLLIPYVKYTYNTAKNLNLVKDDYARNMMQIMQTSDIQPDEIILLNHYSHSDYFYYNNFYKFDNRVTFLSPNYKKGETYTSMLEALPKGKYWFFLSYDFPPKYRNIKEINNWVKTSKKVKIHYSMQVQNSVLIRLTLD